MLEKRLEEARNVARQDISTLENELLERKNMEKLLRSELTNLKEERDVAIGRVSSSRLEADNVSSRARTLSVERNQLHKELDSSASKIRVLEDELKRVSEDYISYREETEKKELHQQQRATNELLENKSELLERMEELKKSHAEELKYVKDMYELNYIRKSDSTEAELKGTIAELQTKLSLLTKELQDANRQISNLHKDLDDEKSNCSALKLRLELCESQKVTLQQELKKSQSYSSNSNRPNSSKVFLAANSPPVHVKKSNFDIDQGISYNINDRMDDIEVPSPIFSEDFGPVSIPSSPALPYNYSGAPRFFAADNSNIKDNYGSWNNNNSTDSHEKARLGTSAANEYARNNQIANVIANSKLPSEQKNYNQHNQRFDNTNSAADNKIDHLIDENTRLKNEVKKVISLLLLRLLHYQPLYFNCTIICYKTECF